MWPKGGIWGYRKRVRQAVPLRWEDFVISLGPVAKDGKCHVRAESLSGARRSAFDVKELYSKLPEQFTSATFDERAATCGCRREIDEGERERVGPAIDPRTIGTLLFNALLPGPIQLLYSKTEGYLELNPDRGLRIVVKIELDNSSEEARLHLLPWEWLHDPQRHRFVALTPKRSILRHLELLETLEDAEAFLPLHLLAASSLPRQYPPLKLGEEARKLLTFNRPPQVQVEVIPHAKLADVCFSKFSRNTDSACEAFHFMGHGQFQAGIGCLVFEGNTGNADPVPGQHLATLLTARSTNLRLVVLNTCRSGWHSDLPQGDPYAGVATALAVKGVPAVVAMREPISDPAAIAFCQDFYHTLCTGRSIDEAMQNGRLEIFGKLQGRLDWGQPMLFLRSRPRSTADRLHGVYRTVLLSKTVRAALGGLCGALAGNLVAATLALFQNLPLEDLASWLCGLLIATATVAGGSLALRRASSIPLLLATFLLLAVHLLICPFLPTRRVLSLDTIAVPGGWMDGDGSVNPDRWIDLETINEGCIRGSACHRITFVPGTSWAGIYWWPVACDDQDPDQSWRQATTGACGVDILTAGQFARVQRVTFRARGEHGNEILQFKVGGENLAPRPARSTHKLTLAKHWKQYSIELEGVDLTNAVALFAWFASRDDNPNGVTFALDDIAYEGVLRTGIIGGNARCCAVSIGSVDHESR